MFESIINLIKHPEQFDDVQESYSQAIDALDDYLVGDPRNMEALEYKITLAQRVRRYTLAKETSKLLIKLGGEESNYLDLYASSHCLAGDFEQAEAFYLRAYKLDPDSNYAFGSKYKQVKELHNIKKQGNECVSNKKTEEAIEFYTTGIKRCEELKLGCGYVFLNNRSACYMNQKKYKEALEDIDKSIQLYPYMTKTYIRRITCITELNLTSRLGEVPVNYLNALFACGYRDDSISTKYATFLRQNKAFKSNVHQISNERDLNRVLENNPDTLIVLDLFASWCGPCKMLAPILDDLSVTHPTVVFLKVDADKERDIAAKYNISAFPTIVLIKNQKEVNRMTGYDPDGLAHTINANMNLKVDSVFELN